MLGKQLELCNKEKNEYKRLIDTLYDKNLSLKKTLYYQQQQGQMDADDESSLLHMTASGSLFSGVSSPGSAQVKANTASTALNAKSQHHFLLRSPKSNPKKSSSATAGSATDTRSTSCLFNDIDSEVYTT